MKTKFLNYIFIILMNFVSLNSSGQQAINDNKSAREFYKWSVIQFKIMLHLNSPLKLN